MNRAYYFDFIEEKLSSLATRIELRSKRNLLDLNLHSENFYLNFCNELFGWKLKNMNVIKHNAEAIDLIDETNQIIIQVSATATKQKIESALSKESLASFKGYSFKFISIAKDSSKLRTQSYNNPYGINFDPKFDIIDVQFILDTISGFDINNLTRIYVFIKKELSSEVDLSKIDSNLAAIINILAQKDWDKDVEGYQIKPYEIDRKIEFNHLENSKAIIDDYKIHHSRVDKIYTEFNKLGVNKSNSVLSSIHNDYLKNKTAISDDDLFFKVIELVIDKIQRSANYQVIPCEELELCVNILVVDAFIRCKIFENPEGYIYAAPR
jgi:hypothetical protein